MLKIGSINITMSGNTPSYGGDGLAFAIGKARFDAVLPDLLGLPADILAAHASFYTREATAFASAIVPYLVQFAEVTLSGAHAHVTNQSLGRTPNPLNPDTAIAPPTSFVDVPVIGSGSLL